MIAFTRQHFFHFFKLIPTTILLILLMDLFYRYNSFLHYATHLQIWKTAAFLWLLLLPIAMILTVIFSLPAILIKLLSRKDKYLKGLVEVSCSSIFLILFTLYSKEFLVKDWAFGNWIFAVILALPIVIGIIYIIYTESFRGKLNNVISIFWIPALVLFIISLIWIGPENVNFRALYGEDNSSRILELSEKAKSKGENGPNIILITFDALSAKDMSLYGYHRKTTPFWEELAKESYVFDNMHTNANLTRPSLLSFLTSKYPWTHGIYRRGVLDSDKAEQSLPTLLKDYNYQNIMVLGHMGGMHIELGLENHFDYINTVSKKSSFSESVIFKVTQLAVLEKKNIISTWLEGIYYNFLYSNLGSLLKTDHILEETTEDTLGESLKILEALKDTSTFLWVHSWPPHIPYWPPSPFKGMYLSERENLNIGKHKVLDIDFKKNPPGEFWGEYCDKIRARYDELILYTDASLRSFIKGLKETGIYDNCVLIITADHGEVFKGRKHPVCGTHGTAHIFEEEAHIPLLIHLPGQSQGKRIKTLAENIDLVPTILDILGKPIPVWIEGESLLPYINGTSHHTDKVKFCVQIEKNQNHQPIQEGCISIYKNNYKMTWQPHTGQVRLTRFKEDPLENNNIIAQHSNIAMLLMNYIENTIPLSPQVKKVPFLKPQPK